MARSTPFTRAAARGLARRLVCSTAWFTTAEGGSLSKKRSWQTASRRISSTTGWRAERLLLQKRLIHSSSSRRFCMTAAQSRVARAASRRSKPSRARRCFSAASIHAPFLRQSINTDKAVSRADIGPPYQDVWADVGIGPYGGMLGRLLALVIGTPPHPALRATFPSRGRLGGRPTATPTISNRREATPQLFIIHYSLFIWIGWPRK